MLRQRDTTMVLMRLIDSFLLRDGRLVNPDGHAARLTCASSVASSTAGDDARPAALAALTEALRALPTRGLFFPRIELSTQAPPRLQARPWSANQLMTTATLVLHPELDQRIHPRLKGPDFTWQTTVRSAATARGASDALLEEPEHPGQYRESAFGTVVWWQDGVLLRAASTQRLASTTEAALVELCRQQAVTVQHAPMTLPALRDADSIWLLSALHTIREVTDLDGMPCRTAVDSAPWCASLWDNAGTLENLMERVTPL